MHKLLVTGLAFALCAGVALPVQAFDPARDTRPTGTQVRIEAARAPLGFQLFCLKNPRECRGGGKSEVQMSGEIMGLLQKVNQSVNRSIRPRHDRGADVWTLGAKAGDCEDYVLAKRSQLIRLGLPPSALRIAHVKTRKGEGHAVLVVRSDRGDLALDNLTGKIMPLSQTGHRVISMSGATPTQWG